MSPFFCGNVNSIPLGSWRKPRARLLPNEAPMVKSSRCWWPPAGGGMGGWAERGRLITAHACEDARKGRRIRWDRVAVAEWQRQVRCGLRAP